MIRAPATLLCAVALAGTTQPLGAEPTTARSELRMTKKATDTAELAAATIAATNESETDAAATPTPAPACATLVQTHTLEHVLLDADVPTNADFSELLRDRATGSARPLDPRLLELLRHLATAHPHARIELVSGFRSPKLNEMMRKKGHNVASHSQHSLGHAVDFRIVESGASRGLDPRAVEKEIRRLGWDGGVGTYPKVTDWFVHADVGRNRHWGE